MKFAAALAAVLLGSCVFCFRAYASTKPDTIIPPLAQATLAPALKAAAELEGVPLTGVASAALTAPQLGDAVVGWIGATDGKRTRQWLIQLRRVAPTQKEGKKRERDVTRYLSWGPAITFRSKPDVLELWLAGPVDVSPNAKSAPHAAPVKRLRLPVPGDYLRLGLDDYARIYLHMARLADASAKSGQPLAFGHIYSMDKPVKPENQKWAKPVAEQIGFTTEMERAWAGGHVAISAFYEIAREVPELRDIATVAVEEPSVLKLAKLAFGTIFKTNMSVLHGGSVDPAPIGLMPVALEAFSMQYGLSFGEDPVVHGEMIVTKPVPPLDVCAGVLGLVAVSPRDSKRLVQINILSAQRATK